MKAVYNKDYENNIINSTSEITKGPKKGKLNEKSVERSQFMNLILFTSLLYLIIAFLNFLYK